MANLLKFPCPHCNARLHAKAEKAGRSYDCPNCSALVKVPATRALATVKPRVIVRRKPPVIVPEVMEDYEPVLVPTRRRKNRDDELVPVKVKIPGVPGAEFEGQVDRKTSNTVTSSVIGGFLVALGAALVFFLGGRGKSA
jgi:DNA-directed RNA polymerase subunit M/transcription elongation factor TFIIS